MTATVFNISNLLAEPVERPKLMRKADAILTHLR